MPFTLSHPAAVLPLMRRPFSRTALVAGAVAPDMPYFVGTAGLPVNAQSWYEPFLNATTTHTALGAATVTLPYALVLWGLAQAGRRPLTALLPLPAAPSSPRTAGTPIRRAGWVVLSVLIGIATHLVWDSFTEVGSPTWARTLQHASTIGGLAVIAVYMWRGRARFLGGKGRTGPGNVTRHRVLLAMALFTVAGAVAHAWWRLAGPEAATTGLPLGVVIEGMLSDAAKGAGAGLIGALALHIAAWWIREAATAVRPRGNTARSVYDDTPGADISA
ncbi:DUF4184 family protein [Streptomyces sp. NPDC005774]|uniref:DUF4184 family protein n=1 Tax=Streptomyces sp. NPDC005774 TaxID=3364728 RepID=UPI0036B7610F